VGSQHATDQHGTRQQYNTQGVAVLATRRHSSTLHTNLITNCQPPLNCCTTASAVNLIHAWQQIVILIHCTTACHAGMPRMQDPQNNSRHKQTLTKPLVYGSSNSRPCCSYSSIPCVLGHSCHSWKPPRRISDTSYAALLSRLLVKPVQTTHSCGMHAYLSTCAGACRGRLCRAKGA